MAYFIPVHSSCKISVTAGSNLANRANLLGTLALRRGEGGAPVSRALRPPLGYFYDPGVTRIYHHLFCTNLTNGPSDK